MKLVSLHGDGRPHRTWLEVTPTAQEWQFYIPAGSPVLEANGTIWSSEYPVIAWFTPDVFYQVFLLLKPDCTEYYCNVISPPVALPSGEIRFYDLDLDVVVSETGIHVLDEEEFQARAAHYPPSFVHGAKVGLDNLLALADQKTGPFAPQFQASLRNWVAEQPCSRDRLDRR